MKKQYSEAELKEAIEAITNGVGLREASRHWHILLTTLYNRLAGRQNHREAAQPQRRLSDVEEDQLALYILNQSTLGLALTRFETRALAGRIASSSPDGPLLGSRWFTSFLSRYPQLKSRRNQRVEAKRLRASSKANIEPWFDLLELPIIRAIKPENRWNADEGGLMEARSENALTLGYADDSPICQEDYNSRAWTSFMECINALGKALLPLIIFKGITLQQQWFLIVLEDYDGWQFAAQKKGWMEERIAIEWLRRVFIPQTAPSNPSDWRLLVIDGHHTHTTIDFMWECFSHRIYIVFLPAHTSYILQPLDVAVFSPLKTAFRKHLHQIGLYAATTAMAKKRFLYCYHKARMEALTEANIRSGWRASGLWPVNRVRALGSTYILENHQDRHRSRQLGDSNSLSDQFCTPQSFSQPLEPIFATPTRSQEMRSLIARYARQKHSSPTQRLLFRKILKGYDKKAIELTMTSEKNRSLEAQVEASRKVIRKKVQIDPNAVFADIKAIRKAQIDAGEVSADEEESDDSSTPTEEGSVIVVAGN